MYTHCINCTKYIQIQMNTATEYIWSLPYFFFFKHWQINNTHKLSFFMTECTTKTQSKKCLQQFKFASNLAIFINKFKTYDIKFGTLPCLFNWWRDINTVIQKEDTLVCASLFSNRHKSDRASAVRSITDPATGTVLTP